MLDIKRFKMNKYMNSNDYKKHNVGLYILKYIEIYVIIFTY